MALSPAVASAVVYLLIFGGAGVTFANAATMLLAPNAHESPDWQGMTAFGGMVSAFVLGVLGYIAKIMDGRARAQIADANAQIADANARIAENSVEIARSKAEARTAKELAAKAHAEAERAKAEARSKAAAIDQQSAEILRLRQGQHDIRNTQQVFQSKQDLMERDVARICTPDPDADPDPEPIHVIVENLITQPIPTTPIPSPVKPPASS